MKLAELLVVLVSRSGSLLRIAQRHLRNGADICKHHKPPEIVGMAGEPETEFPSPAPAGWRAEGHERNCAQQKVARGAPKGPMTQLVRSLVFVLLKASMPNSFATCLGGMDRALTHVRLG
jgi:hypothetical protein